MKTYKQLTLRQRYQIWALKRLGSNQREIAVEVGVHRSTISRELRRNASIAGYNPMAAEQLAYKRRREKAGHRIPEDEWREVDNGLRQYWSPEQVSGRRRRGGQYPVSHERIYQHIYLDKMAGGDLHTYLRCRRIHRKRYGSYRKRNAFAGVPRSIDERPAIVAERGRIGDMEIDTMVGKGHHQAIITIVDRKSKLLRMRKVERKTAAVVAQVICEELRDLVVHTLTSDNGCEFAHHNVISTELGADYYFCHPYSSWERGTNENTNGLIRQFFPKKTSFDTITAAEIKQVEDKLNNRPRKSLGYRTPNEVYFYEKEKLTGGALAN
jgi:IS30 family transposase